MPGSPCERRPQATACWSLPEAMRSPTWRRNGGRTSCANHGKRDRTLPRRAASRERCTAAPTQCSFCRATCLSSRSTPCARSSSRLRASTLPWRWRCRRSGGAAPTRSTCDLQPRSLSISARILWRSSARRRRAWASNSSCITQTRWRSTWTSPATWRGCGVRCDAARADRRGGPPEVRPGDDLGELIGSRSRLESGDVLVVAQKVVSKSEGRLINFRSVQASDEAKRIASRLVASPDPRIVQVILDESVRVLRSERVLITETRHGFVCANGGVDHSNVPGSDELALLPEDPDASAGRLRDRLRELTGVEVGVIVSDTFGRPWRLGIVNVALGIAGLPALLDLRGSPDDTGKGLQATVLAIADDIAAAAGLVMGKTNRAPVVIVRGLALQGTGTGRDLIRPAAEDLFR